MKRIVCALVLFALIVRVPAASGQSVADPGFESYSVAAGGYTQVSGGAWTFNNNAGVVEPFSPHTYVSPLQTWSATLASYEGAQYASAYAGSDFFDQSVTFPAAGQYRFTVFAASPSGQVDLNPGGVSTLTTGDFRFTLGGIVTGPTFTPALDAGWSPYSAVIQVPSAGPRLAGFHTTKSASYFIYFDSFSIEAVPEPHGAAIAMMGLAAMIAVRRRSGTKGCGPLPLEIGASR